MQKTEHLFENGIYLLTNHAVARNQMFDDEGMQLFFIKGLEKHLKPVCEILAYSLNTNQFQLLVRLHNRQAISEHFLSKKRNQNLNLPEVPDSTYVFSQAMANLQVSFVKYFNFINGRSGTLMAGRFGRKLVETESEALKWVERLNQGLEVPRYSAKWAARAMIKCSPMTSIWMYQGENKSSQKESKLFKNIEKINLVGYFDSLPPYSLESKTNYFIMRFNQLFGPKPGYFF